ncbi:MAG: DUF7144 family membrane protein [Candidatus Geothermincolia bacterium]
MTEQHKGEGWVVFASMMMIVAGIANFVWGITAIAKKTLMVSKVLFANLTFWGIIFMIIGVILVVAGFAILNKMTWAIWFSIIWATMSIIFYLFVIWAYPVFSVLVIAIDVLVIYALTVYALQETTTS